jgi:hypothetical protein
MSAVCQSLFLAFLFAAPCPVEAAGDDTHPAIKEFNERVQDYVDLRKKIEGGLPSLSKKEEDPAEIIEHEKGIAAGLRSARAKAARGSIFVPSVQPVLVTTIKEQLGSTARAMIMGDGNPRSAKSPAKVELKVNGTYPSAAPLSTVPPSVLAKLPALPKGLEFRFVGRHLILYDAKANLIVDYITDAIR